MSTTQSAVAEEQLLDHPVLANAQEAINNPEVQDLIKKLSAYNLSVFLPHMHDDAGEFYPMPENVVQVEHELKISFHTKEEIASSPVSMIPIGWTWDETKQEICSKAYCVWASDPKTGNRVHVSRY